MDVIIAGDFNRHDQLWGGEDVSLERQGEADRIIDLMDEFALRSLLRRGTKTWHGWDYDTTIDLVLETDFNFWTQERLVVMPRSKGEAQ